MKILTVWGRRALTLPAYGILWLLALGSLPVTLPLAAAVDLVRRNRWATVRAILMAAVFLTCEMIGIAASLLTWLASGVWMGVGRARFLQWNFALQQWWAGTLLDLARRIYRIEIDFTPRTDLSRGPYLLFIRHTSLADTLLPSALFSQPHGIVLRYVLKRELLWDPCLDIVGNRLPNAFVERGTGNIAGGVGAVSRLMANLGARDGVLIYPEGTRFTPAKRERVLRQMAGKDEALYRRAQALTHVLPPRLGGPLVLLEQNRAADVVFCAHAGLEAINTARDLLDGSIVGLRVRVECWRVPFDQIPASREERIDWLYDHWGRVDAWVAAQTPTEARS
ncbi:MAG: lysophospholipid acyltransferase family protein [Blastocatellia bacterium]|nr:lysophospholipid acyltransferase family protein [Blastocatellia bacterium]